MPKQTNLLNDDDKTIADDVVEQQTEIPKNVEEIAETQIMKLEVPEELKSVPSTVIEELQLAYTPFLQRFNEIETAAKAINVTEISQTEEMDLAREYRLQLKSIRCDVENVRKKLKENINLRSKAIDGMANIIKALIVPIETHLDDQEKFIENQINKEKDMLAEKRRAILEKYEIDLTGFDLREMSEDAFNTLVETSKAMYDKRKEDERITEEKRIAEEAEKEAERKRLEEENRQLKEKEEKDRIRRDKLTSLELWPYIDKDVDMYGLSESAFNTYLKSLKSAKIKADKERAEKEAAAAAEQKRIDDEKKRLEDEQKKLDEAAEKKRLEDEAEAEKKRQAGLLPDKQKLLALAVTIVELEMPDVKDEKAKKIIIGTTELMNKVSNYIKTECAKL